MRALMLNEVSFVSGGDGSSFGPGNLPPGIYGVEQVPGLEGQGVYRGTYIDSDTGEPVTFYWNQDEGDTTPDDYQFDRSTT